MIVSSMPMGAGSRADSLRPALPTTSSTSGTWRMRAFCAESTSRACVSEAAGSSDGHVQEAALVERRHELAAPGRAARAKRRPTGASARVEPDRGQPRAQRREDAREAQPGEHAEQQHRRGQQQEGALVIEHPHERRPVHAHDAARDRVLLDRQQPLGGDAQRGGRRRSRPAPSAVGQPPHPSSRGTSAAATPAPSASSQRTRRRSSISRIVASAIAGTTVSASTTEAVIAKVLV
jgi:hypothetical protein